MSFIAGQYTATLGAAALGQARDGFTASPQAFWELITGDTMAEAPQDAVFRGAAVFVNGELVEYDSAGVANAIWPFGTIYAMGIIGRLAQDLADALVLTALAGTPAAADPASLTFTKAIIRENFPVDILFAPRLRTVPLQFRCFPNSSGVFGTET